MAVANIKLPRNEEPAVWYSQQGGVLTHVSTLNKTTGKYILYSIVNGVINKVSTGNNPIAFDKIVYPTKGSVTMRKSTEPKVPVDDKPKLTQENKTPTRNRNSVRTGGRKSLF